MELSSYAMSDLLGTFNQIEADRRARERRNEAFRSDPNKLDKLVASVTANLSPTGEKPKLSKFSTQTEAYDSTIPEGHPFKNFGLELKERMSRVLSDPRTKGMNPTDILSHLQQKMLMEPGKSGAPRLQEAFEHKRRVDAAWWGGGDVRKPFGSLYDEWLANTREAEKPENIAASLRKSGKVAEAEEYEREVSPLPTATGLAINVGGGALGGGLVAGPAGALLGAAGGALSEVFGRPIAKRIEQTEWYKSRWGKLTSTRAESALSEMLGGAAAGAITGSKLGLAGVAGGAIIGAGAGTEVGKQLLTDMAPYIAGGVAIDKALAGAFLVKKSAAKAIAANPSARNIIDAEDAMQQGRKIMSDESVIGRTVNKLFDTSKYELGVNEDFVQGFVDLSRKLTGKDKLSKTVMRKVIEEGERHAQVLGANVAERVKYAPDVASEEEFVALASRSMSQVVQHPESMEAAMRNPSGFLAGAIEEAPKVRARMLAEDAAANLRVENELLSTAQAFNKDKNIVTAARKVEQDFSNLADTHDLLYTGKQYIPGVEDTHSVLYGGTAPTATTAKVIDDLSVIRREAPSRSFNTISKIMNDYEADPVAKQVFDVTTAPTEADSLFTTASGATVLPTARKLSARMRVAKIDLLRRRGTPEALEEAAYEEAKMLRESRLEEQAVLKKYEDAAAEAKRLDAEYSGEAEKVQRRTKATAPKEDEYANWKDTSAVATEKEAAEGAVDKGLRGKGKKVSAEQAARLEEARRAERELAQERARIAKLDPESASDLMASLYKSYKSGQISPEETLKRGELIVDTITDPALNKFSGESYLGGMEEWAGRFDGFFTDLRKRIGTKVFMAAFGVPAGLVSFFANPEGSGEAEAGVLSSLAKGLKNVSSLDEASTALIKGMKSAGYITSQDIPTNKFLLGYNEFQRGLKGSLAGGPAKIISAFDEWVNKGGKEGIRHKIMSPGMIFEEVLGMGKSLMNNPAVFKASYQAAEYNNIMRSTKVVDNILADSGIKSAQREVREAFKPLTPYMQKQVEFEYRSQKIAELTEELKRYEGSKPKGMKSDMFEASRGAAEAELKEHQRLIEPLKNIIPEYHQKWAAVAEDAAKKYPSVRTFLALGDTPEFEKYPFLKNIKFSPEEKLAVGRLREQLLQYKQRLKDIGEETISGFYAPHIFHPDFKPKEFLNLVGGDASKANVYMRFYRRSFNSRPLMPDIEASMHRYVSDSERRIQQETFWKREGWEKVMHKTQDIPLIFNAFKALKEGVAPMEMTSANKLAQRYAEFEVVKRLFLSPSATLKHLIKVTGDLASRPLSEAAEAAPSNLRMLGLRLAEANPSIRPALEKLGFSAKTEQDRIVQDYFKSLVPAHGTRRMMLDIGLSPADEVFAKAKGLWGKIQDIGGAGINFAELADRGLTVTLGRQIAAKKGMTIEQALYGTYDMLLKNNFLSRELNPAWLNNPKVKAMMMFQGTPFKIMERRLVNFLRSGRAVKDLGEGIFEATKTDWKNGNFNNTRAILRDLRNLRADVKEGEHVLTSNLFLNAALSETDFFGVPTLTTFAKDILITGASTYLAGQAGMNLYHHFFHIPFLQTTTDEPTLNLNPGLTAITRGIKAWKNREEGDDEFVTTKIFQRWLGSGWTSLLPDTARKVLRMSNNDIPKIYQDSKFKYLFAIPSTK